VKVGLRPLALLALALSGACISRREQQRDRGEDHADVLRGAPDACAKALDGGAAVTRFAVIGDYGQAGPSEGDVAALVSRWRPDFVITLGDNNYPDGAAETIDANIGQYFHSYIAPYTGQFGAGAADNRFFPSLGNHDWLTPDAAPYLAYFSLPGNERYYDFTRGDVHLFALDSDPSEPDGVTADSAQAEWLRARLRAATERWRIVYMHHPPYSSGPHGSTTDLQWPFPSWGASLILSGHDHDYERLDIEGLTYVVCGLGGATPYEFGAPLPATQTRFSGGFGAGLIEATADHLRLRFYTVDGTMVDQACLGPSP
jgi:tartrate-resistant acid phosphatase type 5